MSLHNGVMLQTFSWYGSHGLWARLENEANQLAALGYTAVWLPPPGKGKNDQDVGYSVYDLYDLGEFNQNGTVATKYGTKQQLVAACAALKAAGLQVYVDTVFNHKNWGEHPPETVTAQWVDWAHRNQEIGSPYDIAAYTRFDFHGRNGAHSPMKWRAKHFDSVSYDHNHPGRGNERLFRIGNKQFETEVSHEHQNYDYLQACDLDTSHPDVNEDLRHWGRWIVDTLDCDGYRIDAVKHIRASYFREWLRHLRVHFSQRELFAVGEYWSWGDCQPLHDYIAASGGEMHLFDVPLHIRFRDASRAGSSYDLRTIFDRTLVKEQPAKAVTFVDNHDSQPLQKLESWVESWFKPLAYALVLLRRDGYPCVWDGDLRASHYRDKGLNDGNVYDIDLIDHSFLINRFLWARSAYGYGDQHDYFDHPNTIGWVRTGDAQHPGAMAVVMSNGSDGNKWMNVFRPHATFRDHTEHFGGHKVTTNEHGWGNFLCKSGKVSVWLQE
jgi:alpha-amylase